MMQDHYELGDAILKSNESFFLFRSDIASVEIGKEAFAVLVKVKSEIVGYVFTGQGKLLVDAIVETEEGALGKPIQRSLNEPFLMLGNSGEMSRHFSATRDEDPRKVSIDEKTFLEKAQELLDRFSRGRIVHQHEHMFDGRGLIFAFRRGKEELDILLSKDSKLVYATNEMSFVTDGDNSILTGSGQVILSHHGRPFVMETPHLPHCDC
jgi:hypothetical protein